MKVKCNDCGYVMDIIELEPSDDNTMFCPQCGSVDCVVIYNKNIDAIDMQQSMKLFKDEMNELIKTYINPFLEG